MDFRRVAGKRIQWLDTGINKGFSNFLFIDRDYGSNPVLRRIFSLARKHGYQSLVVDQIAEDDCALLASENKALAIRRPDFQRSEVHRISFFKCVAGQAPVESAFLGYVVFKRDFYTGQASPLVHVFESVIPPFRQAEQNNFIHCQRRYEVMTSFGRFSVTGVLYAQQNDITFVCAHVGLRTVLACVLPEADITYEKMNASTFVVHDDNFGPYLCLPRHFLRKDNFRILYGLKRRPTAFSAVQAEAIGFAFFDAITRRQPRTGNDWYDRFSVFTRRGWLVLRTLLVKREDYLGHLGLIRDWQGAQLEPAMLEKFRTFLPPMFWLIEASAPELFNASRRKFGEILLPVDKAPPKPLNASLMLAARLPGMIYLRPGQLQFEIQATQLKGHTSLFAFP